MKKEVTTEAPSVEEAIDAALEELGVQQDVVNYEVLSDSGKRLFGRSAGSPAKVRVWLKDEFAAELEHDRSLALDVDDADDSEVPSEADNTADEDAGTMPETDEGGDAATRDDFARTSDDLSDEQLDQVADAGIAAIERILADLGVEAEIEEYEGDDGEIILDIVGADLGILIGRHGKTLDALQTVVSTLARRELGWHYPILVDVEGYRSRRRGKLEQIAKAAAEKATRQERPVRLRPMSNFERKVVHVALRDDRRVTTASEGEDPDRAVVVTPN